ncbi:MAG: hypothetical protein M3280_04850 [Actinomycetota bacterium]|nr:hypothetical protein [Actinomycetota bacterium]
MTGAIVPHAPLLLEPLWSKETRAAAEEITRAARSFGPSGVGTVIVVSSHGRETGVYSAIEGDLGSFGVPGVAGKWRTDSGLGEALAQSSGLETIPEGEGIDHGILVPLLLMGVSAETSVVAASVADDTEDGGLASSLATAIAGLDERALVVASANTSAALGPRAPIQNLPQAPDAESDFLEALQKDPRRLEDSIRTLAAAGGSCSLFPLTVAAKMFPNRRARVLAHASPVGVGYVVAYFDDDS